MKSFMKQNYTHYFAKLPDGTYETVSRAECLHYDRGNPDPLQRWEWDAEEQQYCIRLAPTAEGKQEGNDHEAALKREQRYQDSLTECVHSDTCESAHECIGCYKYLSRTFSRDAERKNADGDSMHSTYNEPHSNIGIPADEAEKRAGIEALANFLATLCEADRLLWECWKSGMAEKDIAVKLGLKTRKGVYKRKKKLEDKIKSNVNLRDFYDS